MSEKNLFSNALPLGAKKENNEIADINREDILETLLKDGNLTRDIIIREAEIIGVTAERLGARLLSKAGLRTSLADYIKQIEKDVSQNELFRRDAIFSFLEKIQQKPEKVEEEIKLVGFPEIPKKTIIKQPEEEPQPVVIPQKEVLTPEAPILESVQPILESPVEFERPPLPKIWAEPEQVPAPISTPESILPTKLIEHIPQPERKNWWEVKREAEVMAIEDLDGDMKKFEKHIRSLGVAEKDAAGKWQWTGDDKKLVFLGDILGDRCMDGVEITSNIGDLAKQAEQQGGQVDFLCGNHDMDLIRFLCGDGSDNYAEKNADLLTGQNIGIWELAQFDPDHDSELKKVALFVRSFSEDDVTFDKFRQDQQWLWKKLYDKMPEILANMRNSQEGRMVLEDICNIKVAVVHDDILFCHTDPTIKMIVDLTRDGNINQRVSEINRIVQENLRRTLFQNEKLDDNFRRIEETYFNAHNRKYFVEQESFENLAEDLLVKVMEYLYENNAINFNQDAKEDFDENGFKGLKWENWTVNYLFRQLDSIDINKSVIERGIDEWKRENGLSGDYIDDVIEILRVIGEKMPKVFDNNEKWHTEFKKLNELTELIAEKIKNVNPVEDDIVKVRNSGINAIIHGHSPATNRYYDKNDLLIVSPHVTFSGGSNKGIGVSIIKKNGKIKVGGKDFHQ
ncbi:MAG: metallophosphoesterase [uncultured bacterium]|nr:MAG: metallophosphoesterase [uncultured bacterium]HBR71386.1 hypothetical protein [Candidatus Moranbacteria bacterium]